MDDVYAMLYQEYSDHFRHSTRRDGVWVLIFPQAVCNHKQIDRILNACREDEEDIVLILDAMHSCIGCIGDSVPALED